MKRIIIIFVLLQSINYAQNNNLKLLDSVDISKLNVLASYLKYDMSSGNTSVGFDVDHSYKWSGKSPYSSGGYGYFDKDNNEYPYIKRDRDLGQTFKIKKSTSHKLKSIIVRLGYGTNVVRKNMYGKNISLQLFEVTGEPKMYDNGSDSTTEAFHGWPHNRRDRDIVPTKDDYIIGETYKSIAVIKGYVFPSKTDFGFNENDEIDPNDKRLKLRILQFQIPKELNIILESEKTYAYLIMIDLPEKNTGFALGNNYYGSYQDGHGIRREGDGKFPPVVANPLKDFTDSENAKAYESAHFPLDFEKRTSILPSTNGYPDVDTFRDHYFIIEGE